MTSTIPDTILSIDLTDGLFYADRQQTGAGLNFSVPDSVLINPTAPPGPGVPEPAAWALMILGFGATGAAMRRRRTMVAA